MRGTHFIKEILNGTRGRNLSNVNGLQALSGLANAVAAPSDLPDLDHLTTFEGLKQSFSRNADFPINKNISSFSTQKRSYSTSSNGSIGLNNDTDIDGLSRSIAALPVLVNGYSDDEIRKIISEKEKKDKPAEYAEGGGFYKPETKENGDIIASMDSSEIAEARILFLPRITVRAPEHVKGAITDLKKLARTTDFNSLYNRTGGVAAYVPAKANLLHDDINTLKWLLSPSTENINPQIQQIYDDFVKPKLFNDKDQLKSPDKFKGFVCASDSYGCRLADQLYLKTALDIMDSGGKPKEYLSKIYGFAACSSPYNWSDDWTKNNDPKIKEALEAVLTVNVDHVMSSLDSLTRMSPATTEFVQEAYMQGSNRHKLKDSNRCFYMYDTRSDNNFLQHSLSPLADVIITERVSKGGGYAMALEAFLKNNDMPLDKFTENYRKNDVPDSDQLKYTSGSNNFGSNATIIFALRRAEAIKDEIISSSPSKREALYVGVVGTEVLRLGLRGRAPYKPINDHFETKKAAKEIKNNNPFSQAAPPSKVEEVIKSREDFATSGAPGFSR